MRGTCHEALVDGEDEEFVGPQESFEIVIRTGKWLVSVGPIS